MTETAAQIVHEMLHFSQFEDILEVVGSFGRYQIVLAIAIQLAVLCYCSTFVFVTFALLEPKWTCAQNLSTSPLTNNNTDVLDDSCYILSHCPAQNLTIHSQFYSVVEEWGLYCQRAYIPHFIATMQVVGSLIGSQLTGYAADHFGRRRVLLLSFTGLLASSALSVVCVDWITLIICRFMVGVFLSGSITSAFIWSMEVTSTKHSMLMNVAHLWQFAYMITALVAYRERNWKIFTLTMSAIGLPALVLFFVLGESPRWLIQRKQTERAVQVLHKMARWNGRGTAATTNVTVESLNAVYVESKDRHYTLFHLFHTRTLGMYTVLMVLSHFTAGTVATAFVFNVGNLAGNPFLNLFLYGLLRSWIPFWAYFMEHQYPWFGRRKLFIMTIVCISVCFFVVIVCFQAEQAHEFNIAITAFAMLGAVLVNCLWVVLGLYIVELFPTVVRNIAAAFVSIGTEIGGIASPQLLYLARYIPSLPYICLLVICIINLLLGYLYFPETKGEPLPDTLHRVHNDAKSPKDIGRRHLLDEEDTISDTEGQSEIL